MKLFEQLRDKIISKDAKVGIIGLGYVGLPLAVEFAKAGFDTTGFDIDSNRVEDINRGKSYIPDVSEKDIEKLVKDKLLHATLDYKALKIVDAIIICVPTPLRKTREPDISFIISSVEKVAKNIRQGHIIVLESTTYPGTTEEVILPMLKSSNLKVGKDFFLAFSPERVDPGNKKWTTKNIPKIVGGVTSQCTEIARLLYSQVIKEVIPVSSTRVAEMTKLLENTFRSVNIGLVNELSRMCHKLGVDVWEVIDAASTKPFGFMPFYPGPGLGGHCLPVDPLYLSWKARLHGFDARFIELAAQVNSDMPGYVVERISSALNVHKKPVHGSRIFIIGVTYKKDVRDVRESPAVEIINLIIEKGGIVSYHDPYVPEIEVGNSKFRSVALNKPILEVADCVVIITDHSSIDYQFLIKNASLIIDTRNALKGSREAKGKVVKL